MKNKKRIKFGILIATIIAIAIIGTIEWRRWMNQQKKKDKLLFKRAWRRNDGVCKTANEKIAKVAFCWESLEQESVGNGLPQGAGDILSIRIQIIDNNNNKINSFGLAIKPNNWNEPTKIKRTVYD